MDPEFFAKVREAIPNKLCAVVGDDNIRKAELCHNVPPEKTPNVSLSDCNQRFDLYPLGEVVCCCDEEFESTRCRRQLADDVKPPLGERLLGDWREILCKLLGDGRKQLARSAFPYDLFTILLHVFQK